MSRFKLLNFYLHTFATSFLMSRKRSSEKDSCPFSLNTGVTMNLLPSTSYVEGFFIFACISVLLELFIGITSLYLISIFLCFTVYLPGIYALLPDCLGIKQAVAGNDHHNSKIPSIEYLRAPHQVCVRAWASIILLLQRHGVPIYRIGLKAALVARTVCPPLQVQEITILRFSPFQEKVNRLSSWRRTLCRSDVKGLCLNYRYSVFKLQLLLCDTRSKQKEGGEKRGTKNVLSLITTENRQIRTG